LTWGRERFEQSIWTGENSVKGGGVLFKRPAEAGRIGAGIEERAMARLKILEPPFSKRC